MIGCRAATNFATKLQHPLLSRRLSCVDRVAELAELAELAVNPASCAPHLFAGSQISFISGRSKNLHVLCLA